MMSSHIIRDSTQKIACHGPRNGAEHHFFMTRFSEVPSQIRYFQVLTVALTAASVPALAEAQLAQQAQPRTAADDKDAPSTVSAEADDRPSGPRGDARA